MSNMVSSYGIPNGAPQRGFGGTLTAASILPVSRQFESYSVKGSGSISRLTSLPRGMSFILTIEGAPTFVNSSMLKCPGGADYTAIAGAMIIARSEGNGVWRVYPVGDMLMSTFNDNSFVPIASGVRATEVADFANGKYWLNGRNYPSLMSWLNAGNSTFKRASTAWKQDSGGRYFPVYNDAPRLSYDTSGTSLGVLIEGAITNRATYTEDFSNAIWTKSNCSIAGVTLKTPDGVSYPSPGAYIKMIENSSNSIHSVYQQCSNPADAPFTASIFVKAGTRTKGRVALVVANNGAAATFDLTAGTVSAPTVLGTGTAISSSIEAFPFGWYRVSVTGKVGTGATNAYIQIDMLDASGTLTYTGDGVSYLYVWGAQVEGVALPTSYVPVRDGTAVNRSNEFLYRYLDGQPAAFTKILKARTPILPPQAYALLIHMDDGSEANDFEAYQTDTGHIMLQLRAGWVEQGTIDLGYVAPNTDFKIAYRGSAAGFAAAMNGGATLTASLTEWPLTMETERYGINATETFDRFWYSTIAYQATIPVAATNAELQALSA